MLNSLNSGVTGIRNFQTKLDVIGNNIANVNTVAFKGGRTTFEDAFSQTMQGGSKAGASVQVGSGVATAAVREDFSRGIYQSTGRETDLYIEGAQGFFIVKDGEDRLFATRAGDFTLDQEGFLVTGDGHRVQGYNNYVAKGANFSSRGDIRVYDDPALRPVQTTRPDAEAADFKIGADGRVRMTLNDGTQYDMGQVLLQSFQDLELLEKAGKNLYTNLNEAGPLGGEASLSGAPGTNGMGTIRSGAVEMSNVDLASEFAEMITTQRGFQANARIITTSDEMLQEVVNLKR